MKKRLLSLLLALVMVLSLLPTFAFADAPDGAVALVTKDADSSAVVVEIEGNLGDGYYSSLKAAFEACPKDGTACTVTLVDSFMVPANTVKVAKGQMITFDLAGNEIYSNYTQGGASTVIANSGNLTIMDSADESDDGLANGSAGAIYAKSTQPDVSEIPSYGNYVITNSNVLTIRSGHIKNNTTKLEGKGAATYAIDNYTQYNKDTTTVLNINGGLVEGSMGSTIRFASFGDGDFAFNMTDGKVASAGNYSVGIEIQHQGGEKDNPLGFTANISGGVIDGSAYYAFYDFYDTDDEYGGNFKRSFGETVYNITGGCIKGPLYTYAIANGLEDPFHITGGYFDRNVSSHVPDGLYCVTNKDTTYHDVDGNEVKNAAGGTIPVSDYAFKITKQKPNMVAKVIHADFPETEYATFNGAVEAAKQGETVVLLQNAEMSGTYVALYYDMTIDLAGYTLKNDSVTYGLYPWAKNDNNGPVNVTVKNGTFIGKYPLIYTYEKCNFVIVILS